MMHGMQCTENIRLNDFNQYISMDTLVCYEADFILDPGQDREPMTGVQDWSGVVKLITFLHFQSGIKNRIST